MEASSNQGKEANPKEILAEAYRKASQEYTTATIVPDALAKVEYVCQNEQNRAGVRLLMACLLAKVHNPSIDVRKPYTEIGTSDSFSGRTYDEQYIAGFVNEYELPCNSTTAFLTPALRNRNDTLTTDVKIVGRPPQLYRTVLELLNDIHTGKVAAKDLLIETVHCLILERDRQKQRIQALLSQLQQDVDDVVPLSAEGIINLIQSQMKLPHSSRLPVLIIAAAYQATSTHLGEKALPLNSHKFPQCSRQANTSNR